MVALDLPTSWMLANAGGETTTRMLEALNGMMLDMPAAIARKNYTDRRRRQQQGIEKAKAAGSFKGRKEDASRNEAIMTMMRMEPVGTPSLMPPDAVGRRSPGWARG